MTHDTLITFWNQQDINPLHRLGENTKRRIQKALTEALEGFSKAELLATITTYSELYKAKKCDHKYRLVEFIERRGYEHFLNEKNWNNRGRP